jgi:superfamily II DNA or RNA helicase
VKNVSGSSGQVDKTVARILRFFSQYRIEYPAVVFVRHQQAAAKAFEQLEVMHPNLRVSFTHGGQPPHWRPLIVKAFNNGRIDVLIATSVLNTGIDLPNLRSVVLANSTESAIQFKQSAGRGARLSEGKHEYVVYDLIERTNLHNYKTIDTASARANFSKEEGMLDSTSAATCSIKKPMVNNKEVVKGPPPRRDAQRRYFWSKDILFGEYTPTSIIVLLGVLVFAFIVQLAK